MAGDGSNDLWIDGTRFEFLNDFSAMLVWPLIPIRIVKQSSQVPLVGFCSVKSLLERVGLHQMPHLFHVHFQAVIQDPIIQEDMCFRQSEDLARIFWIAKLLTIQI
jgi:hypothetical protein